MDWRLYKNIGANWLGLLTTMVVGFFLTPFILHRLGDVAFGLWVLMATFSGYYGLLDLGIRNAILRYVARCFARQDQDGLSRVVSTSLFSYSVLGLLLLVLSGVTAWKLDSLLRIAPEWSETAKLLLLVFGAGTALGFPLNVFGAVLEGLQQFTWVSGVQVVAALVRAGGIVVALNLGHGVLAIGFITVVVNLLTYIFNLLLVVRRYRFLRIGRAYVQRSTLHVLAGFGLVTFWIAIAQQLRFQTDALVIGSFLSVQAISVFAIGSKLVAYAGEAVQAMAQVFTPMFSHFDATGELQQMRRVLLVGNRYATLVMLPMAAVLVILGKSIIRVWVGPAYLSSYTVLVILAVPMTLYLSQAASTKLLYGMARHSLLARVLLLEGVANLLLSILLARWYGVVGVALGTAIPLACTSLLFLPRHLSRLLNLRLGTYVSEAFSYPLLLFVPLALALWIADWWIQPRSYTGLLLELSVGGIVYGLGLFSYFYWKEGPEQLQSTRFPDKWERSTIP